jgi:type II secretory pathway component GspD/PulD (secretin)
MRKLIFLIFVCVSFCIFADESPFCKDLKTCAEWAASKTGLQYTLGNLGKRSIKLDKGFNLSEGDPDFIFSYILVQNDFARVKKDNGSYEVVAIRELKDYQFPKPAGDEIIQNLDYYSFEIKFSNHEKVKNAMQILKKYLSKNGKILEIAGADKVVITDMGIQLFLLKHLANDINR